MISDDISNGEIGEIKSEGDENTRMAVDTSEIPALAPDTIFELLADCYRRAVFDYLEQTANGRASVSDLAAYVSQHACAGNSPSQVEVHLHHIHLPKIADATLIEYDPERETVQYIGHPLVESCLDLVNTE